MTFLGFNIDRRTGNLTDLQTRAVLEEGIMQQNLFDALIRNKVNLAENFDALPRFVNLFIVKIHSIQIQGVRVIVFNPTFKKYFRYIVAVSFFYRWRKLEYPEKTTDLQ
jgi:hypothetical protein